MHAVVIGGGVIGCAVARALALRGVRVTVVDDLSRHGTASWAAGGMLSPLSETGAAGPLLALADASLTLFADFVRDIESASGMSVEYREHGKLHAALTADDEADLERLAALPAAARFDIEMLDAAAARRQEPALSTAVRGALLVRRDHSVDNRRLRDALRIAAQRAGAELRCGRASAVLCDGGSATGVRLHDGAVIPAEAVVLAAGAWSGAIEGIDSPPVRPVRGQMLAVRSESPLISRVIATPRCYLIPRLDGRLLIGATVEEAGFAVGTTDEGTATLRAAAEEALPQVRALETSEQWFGFRPGTPDALPVLGRDDVVAGVFHATGHYRNGILLAPITAEALCATILSEAPTTALDAFSIGRFRAGGARQERHVTGR